MLAIRRALALVTFALGLAMGCGGAEVTEASCNACAGASYSAEQCHEWGEAAGCETSSFVPGGSGSGCRNGCSFENCNSPPMCDSRTPEPARDAVVDAMVDPRCERSKDGLFTFDPPCDDPDEFNLNGVRYYYCPCSSACPCGYECGSIPLSVGGTIGGACAPE